MNKTEARKISKEHSFTKKELYNILKEALEDIPEDFWEKPNKVNPIFDNGYYFNQCRKWIEYKEGVNDSDICSDIVTFRVLEVFGEYSKIQPPKKKKRNNKDIKIQVSEKPKL